MSNQHSPAFDTDEVPGDSRTLDFIYTKFLIYNDRSFATECARLRFLGPQTTGSESNMAQYSVAAPQQHPHTYKYPDEYLDVDTYTWEDCLQTIEDHEWSKSSLDLDPEGSLIVNA